jgi:hypothetical protein
MYGLNRFHRQFKSSSFKILSVGGGGEEGEWWMG